MKKENIDLRPLKKISFLSLEDIFSKSIKDISTWCLLITNLIVIILAIVQKWNIGEILWIYWMQSIIIGVFYFLKILIVNNISIELPIQNYPNRKYFGNLKYFLAVFFLIHYGIFHLVYMAFLSMPFFLNLEIYKFSFYSLEILISVGLFFANHLFSFLYNFRQDREKKMNINSVIFQPYLRIIPIHLTIIAGGFLFNQNIIILLFFLILKTFSDLVMHVREHA